MICAICGRRATPTDHVSHGGYDFHKTCIENAIVHFDAIRELTP